jgi:hypothetical protein
MLVRPVTLLPSGMPQITAAVPHGVAVADRGKAKRRFVNAREIWQGGQYPAQAGYSAVHRRLTMGVLRHHVRHPVRAGKGSA